MHRAYKAFITCILTGCFFWVSPMGYCQETAPYFRHLTVEDGLSNNWIKAILRDHSGFMWYGTFNGLNRYDGRSFKVYQVNDGIGLSDNLIECLAEDGQGNIWIGTFSGGLNRFDRKTETFVNFQHNPRDPGSVSHNKINAVYIDSKGIIWVGTDVGLDKFDPADKTFRHFVHEEANPQSITAGLVSSIYEDHNGQLWVGTNGGLNALDQETGQFRRFTHDPADANSLAQNYVKSLYEDKYGNLWIGTWGGGLEKYDSETGRFTHFRFSETEAHSLGNNSVLSVTGDNEDQIFVATEGGGLNIFHIRENRFTRLTPDIGNRRSINSNSVHSLYYDPDNGILWAGSYNGGVNYFSKWDKPFILYQARHNGLNNNHITCISEDRFGNLWIGTDGGGVNVLDGASGQFSYLGRAESGKNKLQGDAILSMLADSRGNMWIGSYSGGLDLIEAGTGNTQHFRQEEKSGSLTGTNMSAIYEDRRGTIWVGSMYGGLNRYNAKNNSFENFQHQPGVEGSIIDNFIYGIFEDRHGQLLVQTGKGLEVFDYRSRAFSRYLPVPEVNFGVPTVLHEDSQGNLWIGSQENGLFRVDRTGVKVNNYTMPDGLPSNSIAGILEDDAGNLWISTHKGLCMFEEGVIKPEKISFHVYSAEDGLQGSEFKRGAYCKRKNGQLVFGGQNGLNVFDPVKINNNPFIPPVRITGFKLFNRDVDFKESDILEAPVSEVGQIILDYRQSVFTFEFSALNYILSEKNQYAYMMEGFEESWNYVGTQSNATYSNLDAGSYTFRVKAANNDGIWNEEGTGLKLTIIPPWWENWYFRSAMLFLILCAVFTYYRLRTYQLKKSKRDLERQVALSTVDLKEANALIAERQKEIIWQNEALVQKNRELESQSSEMKRMAEEIKDLNDAKIKFFTNISHELRTPLNLILWPLEELVSEVPGSKEKLTNKHNLMYRNARKLTRLINQLLDFNKIETGTLKVKLEQRDVIKLIRDTMDGFNDWARRKNIRFSLRANVQSLKVYCDEDKIDKILSNLLSNAFKFTDEGGEIAVMLELLPMSDKSQNPTLLVEVRDNGRGIAQEELDLIFNRFYEGKTSKFPGSGIGLSLVKELVELLKGRVWVDSTQGSGSSFYFQIPIDLEKPEKREIAIAPPPQVAPFVPETLKEEIRDLEESYLNVQSVLLVEDNGEILQFMHDRLRSQYHVECAENGIEGFQLATEQVPDLIISDVMMPEMDGFRLCEKLKTDERTSHIPIILLTARSGEENELRGLQIGADDYITKPFQFDMLQLKVKNLLYTRQKFRERFIREAMGVPGLAPGGEELPVSLNPVDEQFMQKASGAVEENLQNAEFNVEDFSRHFDMSRRNVLRKLKGITGLSINEYIKKTRLREAYRLLLQGNLNVSEVAYSVGFTDPKYFSNCFKKEYEKLPSEVKALSDA